MSMSFFCLRNELEVVCLHVSYSPPGGQKSYNLALKTHDQLISNSWAGHSEGSLDNESDQSGAT